MILATDVHYYTDYDYTNYAIAAGVAFADWQDAAPTQTYTCRIDEVKPYVSGQFYQRELPCLLALLAQIHAAPDYIPDCIIVDGFVYLDGVSQAGLGFHLYQALHEKIPVIGVAKSAFQQPPKVHELYRGESQKPLYITAAGLPLALAKQHIQDMHGDFRLPTLLKYADQCCRQRI